MPQHNDFYKNDQYGRIINLKYKLKYKKLKNRVRNVIIENGALTDEISNLQELLNLACEERRYLIERMLNRIDSEKEECRNKSVNIHRINVKGYQNTCSNVAAEKKSLNKKTKTPTKLKRQLILTSDGSPKYPINLMHIIVHSLGEILPVNPNFHKEYWIYPVGYIATRVYAHPKNAQRKCVFTCKILNNLGMPQFQIIPENDLDSVYFGDSADSCHQGLLESLQHSLTSSVQLPMKVQGERFFGLSNPIVQSLLQLDVGFKYCAKFQGFHSKDNPVWIEEEDPTLNFESLQSLIAKSSFRAVPQVKDEPPDELFNMC